MIDEDKTLDTDTSPSDVENKETEDTSVDTEVNTKEETDSPGKKSAEARINELIAKNKELANKLDTIEEKMAPPPPPPTDSTQELTPEVQKAVNYLKKLGFVTKEEQEKKIREVQDRAYLDAEHGRLENRFSGADGRPKYEKREIEEYMRKRGIYDPEVAYEQLFKKELFDFELKKYEGDRKKKPFVQKTGSSAGTRDDNTITREKIAEWIKTPEGRIKYEQNRDKILKMMANQEL